jgi:hypothetical protein
MAVVRHFLLFIFNLIFNGGQADYSLDKIYPWSAVGSARGWPSAGSRVVETVGYGSQLLAGPSDMLLHSMDSARNTALTSGCEDFIVGDCRGQADHVKK